jgi:hypothetical protein
MTPEQTSPETIHDQPEVGSSLTGRTFDRRTGRVLAATLAVSLAITLAVVLSEDGVLHGDLHGPSSYSTSAIGFGGLAELLRELGVAVVPSRSVSGQRAAESAPLVLLAPVPGFLLDGELEQMLDHAAHRSAPTVVVLPKWWAEPDPGRRAWAGSIVALDLATPIEVMRAVVGRDDAEVVRAETTAIGDWQASRPGLPAPRLRSPQLMRGLPSEMQPVMSCAAGVLAAVDHDRGLLVISDPGLFDNSGLSDNAGLAVALLMDTFRARAVVLDETCHGYRGGGSFWRELVEPPLALFTAQLGLLALMVVWRGLERFGPPRAARPRFRPGVTTLVETTARLLSGAGYSGHAVRAYWALIVRRVAARYGIPRSVDDAERRRRLARFAAARGVRPDPRRLEQAVDTVPDGHAGRRRALAVARRVHTWRRGMEDADLRGA